MTRKKRTQEEQPLTTEVVGAKKKSPKKKKAVEEKPVVVQEQEASVNEPTTQEDVAENTPEKREYTIDELIDMLGPDIECEDETEVEDTSSPEKEDNGEDIFATLDDWPKMTMKKNFQMKSLICLIKHLKRKDSVTLTLSGWKGISKNMRKLKGNANFILMKSSGYYLLLQRLDCYWQYH